MKTCQLALLLLVAAPLLAVAEECSLDRILSSCTSSQGTKNERKTNKGGDDDHAPASGLRNKNTRHLQEENSTTSSTTSLSSSSSTTTTTTTTEAAPAVSSASSTSLNATVISTSACKQIDLAISYITSLDFDQDSLHNNNNNNKSDDGNAAAEQQRKRTFVDVYLLQIVITPICLLLVFFGSSLLLPASILSAAALGVFLIFHVLSSYTLKKFDHSLDCNMKLVLSVVMAFITALSASTCIKFGLFSLGAVAAGVSSYLLMDAFPVLDLGTVTTYDVDNPTTGEMSNDMDTMTAASDLSSFAWMVTISMGILGGVFIRAYEKASLEILTATLGGIGCAYSLHTLVILEGGELDRSIVFLCAFLLAVIGWRFQRNRRLARTAALEMWRIKNDGDAPYPYDVNGDGGYSPVVTSNNRSAPGATSTTTTAPPPPPSWQQLQQSIDSLHGALSRQQQQQRQQQPSQVPDTSNMSMEQIEELAMSLNAFLDKGNTELKVQEGKAV